MKNKNKIIAIIVAIVLVASIFVVGTVANTKNTSIAISIDKTELLAGQSATVTVTASADYPVATASIPVFYDKTMVTVSDETATLTGYDVAEVTTDSTAVDSSKIYANTDIDIRKFGFVLVTYIGGVNDTVSTIDNKTVLTFTITAKSDVSGDALVKCVTESAKTDNNVAGMLYFGSTTSGAIITSIPENVENINVSATLGSVKLVSEAPELILTELGTGVSVINTDIGTSSGEYVGLLYGVDTINGESLEDYFTTESGSVEFCENENGVLSTGSVVLLKDNNGNVVEKYVFVYFGDVNGDGTVDITDSADIEAHDQWLATFDDDSAAYYAADVNYDGTVDITDSADVEAQDQWLAELDSQATIAAGINAAH